MFTEEIGSESGSATLPKSAAPAKRDATFVRMVS